MMEPTATIALAGDTMLGRGVAAAIREHSDRGLLSKHLKQLLQEADAFILNLECCISDRGWPLSDPSKPFLFRAPPEAVHLLRALGVSCVTLANNHALDFGEEALLDTFRHLEEVGIPCVGAGTDIEDARAATIVKAGDLELAVIGIADHPADYAAGPNHAGTAYVNLQKGVPRWLRNAISEADADAVLATPHWGPNMAAEPLPYIRAAARELIEAGATLVAGHSAHVFHGVEDSMLYDLGDFIDDYAVDAALRNDLGLLFLVTLTRSRLLRIEAIPIKLDFCLTGLAEGDDAIWIAKRFLHACARFGTRVHDVGGRLVIETGVEEPSAKPA